LIVKKPQTVELARRVPQQVRAKDAIEKILAASCKILIADGIGGLTTRKIALAAGISTGVLYQYFPSKQAVLYRIFDERLQRALAVFDKATDDLSQPLETVSKRFVELQQQADIPNRLDLELRNAVDRDPRLAEMTQHFERDLSARYIKILKAYGSTMTDGELNALANYMHELDHINMKLQLHASKEERKLHAETTAYISYSLFSRSAAFRGESALEPKT
jgi:AcrR family transcriptional regulator